MRKHITHAEGYTFQSGIESKFIQTIAELTPANRAILGLDEVYKKLTKNGELNPVESNAHKVVNQANKSIEILLTGYMSDYMLNRLVGAINDYRDANDNENPRSVLVRFNSGGGSAFAGMAIYNYLVTLDTEVTTVIDGLAASAAATAFMAGENRLVQKTMNTFMIHRAMSFIDIFEFGNQDYLKKIDVQKEKDNVLQLLNLLDNDIIDLYVDNTKLDKKSVLKYMKDEYFFSNRELLNYGIATGTYEKPKKDEESKNQANEVDSSNQVRSKGETASNDADLISRLMFVDNSF